MRRLMAGAPEAASGSFARRVGLLLLLAASLAGFFLLLDLLSSLVASGPEDILAVNPSEEDKIALPSGVGLLAFCVVAVSVILGIVAFLVPQHRPLRLNIIRLSVPLFVGAALAVALIGAGVYLASSGILGQEIPYDQYLVERSSLQPGRLGVLAFLFLSVTLVGILVPPFLVPLLLLFLLVCLLALLTCGPFPSEQLQTLGGAGSGSENERGAGDGRFPAAGGTQGNADGGAQVETLGDESGSGEGGSQRSELGAGMGQQGETEAVGPLGVALSALAAVEEREEALQELEETGASVDRLENGTALVTQNGISHLSTGTTTEQVTRGQGTTGQGTGGSSPPLFEVTGAGHTGYLRTSVGDVYEAGSWRQLDPVTVPYTGAGTIANAVAGQYASTTSEFAALSEGRRTAALLFGLSENPIAINTDRIRLRPTGSLSGLSRGPVPTSLTMVDTPLQGDFHPLSATFATKGTVTAYSWTSNVATYSDGQYSAAILHSDPTYTQLPADLPVRIRRLALDVTEGHATPYGKAKALEQHLKTQYTYRFASTPEEGEPPAGRDPADWFLFDHREGTCGSFSTAFVVLARSIRIPARVVSGWAVTPTDDPQIVRSDQAHQWAEVPFEGIGWVRFEPTPSEGALSRLPEASDLTAPEALSELVPKELLDTVTNITQWPTQMHREIPFTVGGTVDTVIGDPVSGMTIEVYVNETKEHGGTKIGTAQVGLGNFQAEVQIPATLILGAYQLLARAVPNDDFNESWSDPDITVVSSSGFEITGPSEVPVDVEVTFRGRVSQDNDEGDPDREVRVTIDGNDAPSVITGPEGRFSFTQSFSEAGPHWVEVAVQREDFLLDNSARLTSR